MIEIKFNVKSDMRGCYEDEIVEQIFENRGVSDPEHFLNPTVDDLIAENMLNTEQAADIIIEGIDQGLSFHVLYDTDLDGITSGTIMTRFLKHFSDDVKTFINNGKAHGLKGQDNSRFDGADILIVVDSLDADIVEYKKLHDKGVQIIVLDHHAINPEIPYDDYVTLVSSQRSYANPALSGAGVVWKFCRFLDDELDTDYSDDLIDLACCGIVGDMMDVSESSMENRYIVKTGLQNLKNPAIKKIVGNFDFNSTAVAFSIAPLINAAQRVGENEAAMNAFLADDNKEVLKYVKVLKKCKEIQNEEVENLMPEVIEQCEKQLDKKMMIVMIDSEYGISGLFGNKLLERFKRPVLILKDCGDVYAGSMRAVGTNDFRKFINNSGLAECSGHELAAGITIPKDNFKDLCSYVEKNFEIDLDESKDVDVELDISDITRSLIDKIKQLNFVSGTGWKPVTVKTTFDEYTVGDMSNGRHLVLRPTDYLDVIKWNFSGDRVGLEDASMMEEPVTVVAGLDSGFLGRRFSLKLIVDDMEVGE